MCPPCPCLSSKFRHSRRSRAATSLPLARPVVAVLADTAAGARDAADLVEVEYDPQPVVSSAEAALQPDAPRVHPEFDSNVCYTLKKEGGDVERAFREADTVVKVRVDSPRVAPMALEPRGCVAVPGGEGGRRLTVWISSQAPHGARADIAPPSACRTRTCGSSRPTSGGGFGAKTGATPEYLLASHFAVQLGRPVKWVATRSEDVQVTTQGRDMLIYVELAATARRHAARPEAAQHRQPGCVSAFGVGDSADVHPEHGFGLLPHSQRARGKYGGLHQHALDRSVPRGRAAGIRCWRSSAASTTWRASWAWTPSSCGARTSSRPRNSRTPPPPAPSTTRAITRAHSTKRSKLADYDGSAAATRRGAGARRAGRHRHLDVRRAQRQRRAAKRAWCASSARAK